MESPPKHSPWRIAIIGGIIAGTIASVLAGLILKVTLADILGVGGAALRWLGNFLTKSIGFSAPLWVWLVFATVAFFLGRSLIRFIRGVAAEAVAIAPITSTPNVSRSELNELELRILDYFARSDLRTFLNATQVSLRIAREPLRTERSLDHLNELGLLAKSHSFVDGTTFSLSTLGRNFVIDQGIA